ncbi:Conserved_hypothetical protein [Hexamita inflata]|uniref:Uncharacterized protein n=1 Tax=Hexamita inflata TaxID=28002 RepID=A0AA86UKQ8_9EUKA|nr:Conserved hypothetical protein [Hexamita inflata]
MDDGQILTTSEQIRGIASQIQIQLDQSPRDNYDYIRLTRLIQSIQTKLAQFNTDFQHLAGNPLIISTIRSLLLSIQCLLSEISAPKTQFTVDVLESALLQFQLSLLSARFKVDFPSQPLQKSDLLLTIDAFWSQLSEPIINLKEFSERFQKFFEAKKQTQKDINIYLQFDLVICKGDAFFLAPFFEFFCGNMFKSQTQIEKIRKQIPVNQKKFDTFQNLINHITKFDKLVLSDELNQAINKLQKQAASNNFITELDTKYQQVYQQVIQINQQQIPPPVLTGPALADMFFNNKSVVIQQIIGQTQQVQGQSSTSELIYSTLQQYLQTGKPLHNSLIQKVLDGSNLLASQKKQDISQITLRTANAAPFAVVKLLSREAARILNQNSKNLQKQAQLKIAKTMASFSNQFVDLFYKDLQELNPNFGQQKMFEKDVKNLLLQSSEIDSLDYFIYQEKSDPTQFITESIQKLIALTANFGFLCYQDHDRLVSQVTGQVCPFGGFSCRLVLQYYSQMQQFWNQFEAIASAFTQAQRVVIELIQAKEGSNHQIFNTLQLARYIDEKSGRFFAASLFGFATEENVQNALGKLCNLYKKIGIENLFLKVQFEKASERIKNINKTTQNIIIMTEAKRYKQQKQSSLNQNVFLTQECIQFCEKNDKKESQVFGIAVLGMPKSGSSTLVNQLVYNPAYRFTTITESLAKEQIQFSPGSLIKQPPGDCWKLLSLNELSEYSLKKSVQQKQIQQDDEVVSMGSWISMDSTNLQQKEVVVESDMDITRGNISTFLASIKAQDQLLKTKLQSKGDEFQIQQKDQLNTQRQSYTNYNPEKQLIYADLLTQVPKELFSYKTTQYQFLDPRQQIIAEESVNQKLQSQQKLKKQAPLVSFTEFQPSHTEAIASHQINLLQDQKIQIHDIPIRFIGISTEDSAQKIELEAQKSQITALIETQKVQTTEVQKQLIGQISNLFALFQKQLLHQALRQSQQATVGLLVNQKTRQLEYDQLVQLQEIIKRQLDQVAKEAEASQLQIKDLSISFEKLKIAGDVTPEVQKQVAVGVQQLQQKLQGSQQMQQQLLQESQLCLTIGELHKQQQMLSQEVQQSQVKLQYLAEQLSKTQISPQIIVQTLTIINQQNLIIFVYDPQQPVEKVIPSLGQFKNIIVVCNKVDQIDVMERGNIAQMISYCEAHNIDHIFISAKTQDFVNDLLRIAIVEQMGVNDWAIEGGVYKL